MNTGKYLAAACFLIGQALVSASISSAVPQIINYQGYAVDSTGAPLNGNQLVKFTIYDKDSTAIWNSNFNIVPFSAGLFNDNLGEAPHPALPATIWSTDTLLTLGITIGVFPEFTPRTRLVASPFAFEANHSDSSDVSASVDWYNITTVPVGFSDGVDDNTTYAAGTGLTLSGGQFSIPSGGVTSTEILNNTITDTDINASAAIAASKINGTAATLSAANTFSNNNRFNARLNVQNSGGSGIVNIEPPDISTTNTTYGLNVTLQNSLGGVTYGINGSASRTTTGATGGVVTGVQGYGQSDYTFRYGVRGIASSTDTSLTTGNTYGLNGFAFYGLNAYGVYGTASNADFNWAGYFQGNTHITGTLSKAGGSFRIDHPLDPENKILQHSFIESPDMMNIYNGNVSTDADGLAIVTLPDYFDALNKDFRYQLTTIGQFAQAIVETEIESNQFTIRTDKPNVKVSWMVTGIRYDKWAEANRIQVEVDKHESQKGFYLHHEAFGLPVEKSVDRHEILESRKALAESRSNAAKIQNSNEEE
jgi:hypothetical protein